MLGNGKSKTKKQWLGLTGPALILAVTVGAVPAQADVTANAAASAGTTWSQTIRRKLNLETQAVQLTAQLPALKAAVTTRNAEVTKARRGQTAAETTVTGAAAADLAARTKRMAAKKAVETAKKAVSAAKKKKPYSKSRVTKARKALTTAEATFKARHAAAGTAAAALKTAQTAYASATRQVTAAVNAHQTAVNAVTGAEATIKAWPARRTALTAQAAEIRNQVVTETRARFTMEQTTTVYGVTVNKIVATPFKRMLDDAAKAGIPLSGGGFRTKQRQVELRTINGCPDVWTAPASSCRVPTAIPGRSLHELGLAIDMTYNKKTINSRSSKAFKWMAANAGKYGFVNLPSEPWHWSINGS
ncbi:M15 family metallopeptidase [Actinoplanes sp. NBC_00393]|uniref:M15 family metallopeptidase n=1 Tax=Actinoplanes sp. NBC_00393 TaxID=2975953 RepID=UPI002E1B7010